MLEKVLVFIGIPVDPPTEKAWDELLEASGYQAFFTHSEWRDVDFEGSISRAAAVREHLKQYSDTSEAVYVDQPQRIAKSKPLTIANTPLPLIAMPDSPDQLLELLDALFASA